MASPKSQRPDTGKKKSEKFSARQNLADSNARRPEAVDSQFDNARLKFDKLHPERAAERAREEAERAVFPTSPEGAALARKAAWAKAIEAKQAKQARELQAEAQRLARKAAEYRASPQGVAEAIRKADELQRRNAAARIWSEAELARRAAKLAAYQASPNGVAAAEADRKARAASAAEAEKKRAVKAARNAETSREETRYQKKRRAEALELAAYQASPEGVAQARRERDRPRTPKETHQALLEELSKINRPSSD